MTKKRINKLYDQHINLIRKRAWHFAKVNGRDFNELESEAHVIFMRAVKRWDGKRKFSTWLYRCLQNDLTQFIRHNDSPVEFELNKHEHTTTITAHDKLGFKDMVANLSDEARHVVELLLTGPCEALEIIGTETAKTIRGHIHNYLISNLHYTHRKAWKIINELKEAARC